MHHKQQVFLKAVEELTDNERADLARISSRLPALETAWKLKEALRTWYGEVTVETAEAKLDAWIKQVREHGPEPMQQALSAFPHWKQEILAFFRFLPIRISNGYVEGKNNRTKAMMRRPMAIATFSICVYAFSVGGSMKHKLIYPPEGRRATFRERLTSLTRKYRHAAVRVATLEEGMYLIGCTYNFCFPHQELSKKAHFGCPTTPAMAAALTDHIWSIREIVWYKVSPAPFVPDPPMKSKRPRGRPRKPVTVEPTQPKRSRGRPPKYVMAEVVAAARAAGSFTI